MKIISAGEFISSWIASAASKLKTSQLISIGRDESHGSNSAGRHTQTTRTMKNDSRKRNAYTNYPSGHYLHTAEFYLKYNK